MGIEGGGGCGTFGFVDAAGRAKGRATAVLALVFLPPPTLAVRFVHSGYMLFSAFWLPLYWSGVRKGQSRSVFKRYRTNARRLAAVATAVTALSFLCAYSWYLSLTRTTVASNNSIYQVWLADPTSGFRAVAAAPSGAAQKSR
jgi:hypothetical protein